MSQVLPRYRWQQAPRPAPRSSVAWGCQLLVVSYSIKYQVYLEGVVQPILDLLHWHTLVQNFVQQVLLAHGLRSFLHHFPRKQEAQDGLEPATTAAFCVTGTFASPIALHNIF